MRILYFNQHSLIEDGGGSTWAGGVLPILASRGHEVDVATCHSSAKSVSDETIARRLGVSTYFEVPSRRYPLSIVQPTGKALGILRCLLRSSDILYFNNAVFHHAALLGRIKNDLAKPSVAVYHSPLFSKLSDPIQAPYWKTLGKRHTLIHDGHQPLNERDYRILEEWKAARIRKIGAGVDFSFFAPIERSFMSDDEFVILFCGRLRKDKGFDIFLDAVRFLCRRQTSPTLKFIVAGDGPLAPLAFKFASRYAQLSYLGLIRGRERLRQVYRKSNLLVVPSRVESSSHVLLEAAACGTPSIVFDIPPLDELLPRTMKSLAVSSHTPRALAEKISEVAALWQSRTGEYEIASRAFRDLAALHDWRLVVNQIEGLLSDTVNEYRGG